MSRRKLAVRLGGIGAAYLVLAWIFGWAPLEGSPRYFRNDGVQGYWCGESDLPRSPDLVIEYRNRGHVAVVRRGGPHVTLRFTHADFMTDYYRAGDTSLTLDPEVRLVGSFGERSLCN